MIDCGTRWGEQRFWTPSLHYHRTAFALLTVTNLDEDHLSDFEFLRQHCTIPWIASNPTVGIQQFRLLKKDGMGPGSRAFANWLATPRPPNSFQPTLPQPDWGPVQVRWYWNPYQPGFIDSTNDLSVVVIVQYGVFKIVFSGDLEAKGWKNLLRNPNFVADIQSTAIFVASHHGRESGCCTILFDLMRPEIVVISDDEHKYDSQDTGDWYRTRCRGIPVLQNPPERRYVMTTRKDGAMQIDVGPDGRWLINTVPVTDWPRNSGSLAGGLGFSGLAANSLGLASGLEPSLSSLMRFGR